MIYWVCYLVGLANSVDPVDLVGFVDLVRFVGQVDFVGLVNSADLVDFVGLVGSAGLANLLGWEEEEVEVVYLVIVWANKLVDLVGLIYPVLDCNL